MLVRSPTFDTSIQVNGRNQISVARVAETSGKGSQHLDLYTHPITDHASEQDEPKSMAEEVPKAGHTGRYSNQPVPPRQLHFGPTSRCKSSSAQRSSDQG